MRQERKRLLDEPTNHDRWLVSYADFITLLFAFFVVMYASSSVNASKYKQVAESMGAAFNSKPIAIKDKDNNKEKDTPKEIHIVAQPIQEETPSQH